MKQKKKLVDIHLTEPYGMKETVIYVDRVTAMKSTRLKDCYLWLCDSPLLLLLEGFLTFIHD